VRGSEASGNVFFADIDDLLERYFRYSITVTVIDVGSDEKVGRFFGIFFTSTSAPSSPLGSILERRGASTRGKVLNHQSEKTRFVVFCCDSVALLEGRM
jgi:hypothetical protein